MSLSNNTTLNHRDYFEGLLADRVSKFLAVFVLAMTTAYCCVLLGGIVWYDKFGSDKKRTLQNRLMSSLSSYGILAASTVFTLWIFRFITRLRFPLYTCRYMLGVANMFFYEVKSPLHPKVTTVTSHCCLALSFFRQFFSSRRSATTEQSLQVSSLGQKVFSSSFQRRS